MPNVSTITSNDTSWEYPAPLQDAGAEDFVVAENFEGGSGHAGNGDRITQRVEDFDGISLGAVRSHVMVHQLDDVAATEPMLLDVGIGNRMAKACSRSALHISG